MGEPLSDEDWQATRQILEKVRAQREARRPKPAPPPERTQLVRIKGDFNEGLARMIGDLFIENMDKYDAEIASLEARIRVLEGREAGTERREAGTERREILRSRLPSRR